jgi:hypothetical protein
VWEGIPSILIKIQIAATVCSLIYFTVKISGFAVK